MPAFGDVVEAYRIPVVVRLTDNLYALAYRLMKMVPARHIMRQAADQGLLEAGATVVETTSGTFGLALAMECAITDRPLVLVSDPVIDAPLQRRLEDLGATVDIVRERAPGGGYQATRLARVAELMAALPSAFCPEQYTNPANPASYALVADLLADQLGQVDCLVGPVGSGGSMCGTASALREAYPDLRAIGVDTHRSVLFGQPDGLRALRGLGNSLVPANLDHRQFDEVHWVDAGRAYAATRDLHRRHALFMGPTSGASYLAGAWWAARNPDALTVVVLPDEGFRYLDTVYDDAWLTAGGWSADAPGGRPVTVGTAADGVDGWSRLLWGRRSLAEVVGADLAGVA
ncbi:cysteine synthase family protein [Actinosynnema sp. NPDC023794]